MTIRARGNHAVKQFRISFTARGIFGKRRDAGFFVPGMVMVFLVVIFIAALFGTRALNKSRPVKVNYSERYHELIAKDSLSTAEQVELELETCRYRRDMLRFLQYQTLANRDAEMADYRRACGDILPLEK